MGNVCINLRRKKRLEEQEANFRRKMEARIQQSSKRLKSVPVDQLNKILNQSDLVNIRTADLSRPNCTPLRPNSQGVFVEVDQQYIDEQLNSLNRLNKLDKLNLIGNEWKNSELLERQESVYDLSRLNQLRLLSSNPSHRFTNQMNSFDNKSFVNASIDSNLFDQNLFNVHNLHTNYTTKDHLNSRLFNQQINQINSQLKNHSSLHSIDQLIKPNLFNSDLLLHKPQLDQLNRMQSCNNILDMAANRIFSELTYMDNQYAFNQTDGLQFESRNLCYLPLDGFMKLNGRNSNSLYEQRLSNHFDNVHLNEQLANQANQINDTHNQQPSDLSFNTYLATVDNDLKNQSSLELFPSLENANFVQPVVSTHADCQVDTVNLGAQTIESEVNECSSNVKDYIVHNEENELIEEEQVDDNDEMNDSGNGSGCTDRQISRAESMENQLINSQIEMEPWFFARINSRLAAEHVLRMKGNREGAFLVRHAQKIKFTTDAPFVLSLKVLDMADKSTNEKQQFDKSQNDKPNHPTSSNHTTSENPHYVKTTNKNILHYKIYSHLVCVNCDLKMYYINPNNQFTTIRQLISFYSANDNGDIPIRLNKPCLPFDYLNCCYSANVSSANGAAHKLSKLNCEICNELMSSARANRWSTGNLSGAGNQTSQTNSMSGSETYFQTYIEHNPDSFVKTITKSDESSAIQLLSRSLNSIKANSVDRISNNGIPVNSTNRILTDIKFEDEMNKLNQLNQLNYLKQSSNSRIRFSNSLDDVGLNSGNMLCIGLSTRLSLKDRFQNRSLASINCSDGNSHDLTSSGSSLSRNSSDLKKSHVRTSSLISGHKHRISSSSFKENMYISADNLKRRSSSIQSKPGNSGKYHLTKVNSASVTNVSSLKNLNA